MSNLRKTIQINPNLFKVGGKSRKNKGEKGKGPSVKPIISPNLLKNKLLKRIKDHKQQSQEKQETEYTDEFNDSLEYLKSLTLQKKTDDFKKKTIRNKLHLKTSPSMLIAPAPTPTNQPNIQLDLPEELKDLVLFIPEPQPQSTLVPMTSLASSVALPVALSTPAFEPYKLDKEVPYGCLKNGFKKTYRNYKPATSVEPTLRELKLKQLREQIKENASTSIPISMPIQQPIPIQQPNQLNEFNAHQPPMQEQHMKQEAIKQRIKKTTIRKHRLGKSKTHRVVGILIKDNNTRRQILTAQKELKKTQMNVIKKYLNDKNMIKCGSNAPNDVLRKMYEMLMLSGEIQNNNQDIMLHNFLKASE